MALDLQNIDVQNLHTLNFPAKLGLAIALIIIILGLGYYFQFNNQWTMLKDAEAKEIELKAEYEKKSVQAANLEVLEKELEELNKVFNVLLKQLPTQAEIPNLIQELNRAATDNTLRIGELAPSKSINDGAIEILPYKLSITGNYEQVVQFTRDVGALSRIITLSGINITPKDNEITLSAIASTYKARPAEEVAAELAAAKAEAAKASTNKK